MAFIVCWTDRTAWIRVEICKGRSDPRQEIVCYVYQHDIHRCKWRIRVKTQHTVRGISPGERERT